MNEYRLLQGNAYNFDSEVKEAQENGFTVAGDVKIIPTAGDNGSDRYAILLMKSDQKTLKELLNEAAEKRNNNG